MPSRISRLDGTELLEQPTVKKASVRRNTLIIGVSNSLVVLIKSIRLSAKLKIAFVVVCLVLRSFFNRYCAGSISHQLAGTAEHKSSFFIVNRNLGGFLFCGCNLAFLGRKNTDEESPNNNWQQNTPFHKGYPF